MSNETSKTEVKKVERQTCKLKKALVDGGKEKREGEEVKLAPHQVEKLRKQGYI